MKKTIAISMSTVLLMNAAPVFALETVKPGSVPTQGAMAGVTPAATEKGSEAAIIQGVSEVAESELADLVGLTREEMNAKVSIWVAEFKKQQALIDKETDPTIKKLMKAQVVLAGVGMVGLGNGKTNDLIGGRKGLIVANLSTILTGAISVVRMYKGQGAASGLNNTEVREKLQKDVKVAKEKLDAMFRDPAVSIPTPIINLHGRIRDITDALQKLDDTQFYAGGSEWVKIASAAGALLFLVGHFVQPKLVSEIETAIGGVAQAKGKLGALKTALANKATAGTNVTNIAGNSGLEVLMRGLSYSSADADALINGIMKDLGTAITIFEEVNATELRTKK